MTGHTKEETKKIASMGGKASVAARRRQIDVLWDNWREGYADSYKDIMQKLLAGEKITDGEKEFCDRYERNLEFVTPKLARTESKIDQKTEITGKLVYTPDRAKLTEGD